MKTHSMSANSGYNVTVRFLTDSIARIQIFPAHWEYTDSALNKYHFITEPDCAGEITCSETDTAKIWSSSELCISCSAEGLLSCKDAGGKNLLEMTNVRLTKKAAFASFKAKDDEDWVGFSDLTRKRLYHRGNTAICWVSNVASYLPVPFFMSTNGYSILVNSTHSVIFDMCNSEKDIFTWKDERGVVDFYLIKSDTFKDGIRGYTDLTGRPKLPPEWAFGLWYICRTQANDTEVMNDAFNFRKEKIPCDLIGLEPGWMDIDYDSTTEKSWNKKLFPLPDWQKKGEHTFIKALKRMGFHLELWLCNDYDLSFEEERKIAGDIEQEDSNPGPAFDENAELDLHFTLPHYMDKITKRDEPWFEHLKQFVDWGADFFKQDGAYQVCTHPDRLYGNGMTDAEMHNLYPLLYSRQMWEGFAEYTKRRPVVFTPSGWAGFQSWCGTWTGDTGGRLETLGAMLNTAMLGHCWATNDMEVMQPEGIHFGYLQPWSQINSWTYFRMPWLQGDKLFEMHKFYANLRSRLIPYIYSSARESTITSVPLMRPLTLEYQNDVNCRSILSEYLLGRDLLVAIYKHDIYLPEGQWKDYWTGEIFQGGRQIDYNWPEDRGGGLFVREGAIVTFGPVMQYRHEIPLDSISLYLFPAKQETSFSLYEDDGVTFDYQDGKFSLTDITMKMDNGSVDITIGESKNSEVKNWDLIIALPSAPKSAAVNGTPIDGVQWDETRKEASFTAVPGNITIQL